MYILLFVCWCLSSSVPSSLGTSHRGKNIAHSSLHHQSCWLINVRTFPIYFHWFWHNLLFCSVTDDFFLPVCVDLFIVTGQMNTFTLFLCSKCSVLYYFYLFTSNIIPRILILKERFKLKYIDLKSLAGLFIYTEQASVLSGNEAGTRIQSFHDLRCWNTINVQTKQLFWMKMMSLEMPSTAAHKSQILLASVCLLLHEEFFFPTGQSETRVTRFQKVSTRALKIMNRSWYYLPSIDKVDWFSRRSSLDSLQAHQKWFKRIGFFKCDWLNQSATTHEPTD